MFLLELLLPAIKLEEVTVIVLIYGHWTNFGAFSGHTVAGICFHENQAADKLDTIFTPIFSWHAYPKVFCANAGNYISRDTRNKGITDTIVVSVNHNRVPSGRNAQNKAKNSHSKMTDCFSSVLSKVATSPVNL